MKIVSIVLLVTSAFLSLKHGWDAFQPAQAAQAKMMASLGIHPQAMPYFGVFALLLLWTKRRISVSLIHRKTSVTNISILLRQI